MRALILYHPKSDHSGIVEDYIRDFKNFKNKQLEGVSLETVEGADLAKLYDVTRYPAVLVIGPDGQLQQLWQEDHMPLMNEVDAYMRSYETNKTVETLH